MAPSVMVKRRYEEDIMTKGRSALEVMDGSESLSPVPSDLGDGDTKVCDSPGIISSLLSSNIFPHYFFQFHSVLSEMIYFLVES